MKVERRAHPRGEKGTRLSLHEAAKRAAEGRLDPRTRAWAIEKLAQANWPKGSVPRAVALLEALRRERHYVPDPTDAEFMPSAACTLAGCEGLTFLGEDCDGLLIAYLAACGSVGIEGAVVGHGYANDGQLSHVLAAVYDGKRWHLADPSTKKSFGTVDKPLRERWVAVPSGAVLCDNAGGTPCNPNNIGSGLRNLRETGDFVGVGAPNSGQLAAQPAEASRYVLGDSEQQLAMAARAKWDADQTDNALYDLWIKHRELQIIREEYADKPLAETGASELGRWTEAEEQYFQQLLEFGDAAISYGFEAGKGHRPVAWDTAKQTVAILGSVDETALSMDDNGDMTIATASSTQLVQSPTGQVGVSQYVIVGGIVAGVVIAGLTYLSIDRVCDSYDRKIDYAKSTDLGTIHQNVAKTYGIDKANETIAAIATASSRKARAEAEKARAEGEPFANFLKALETAAYVTLGIGIVGLLAYGGVKVWNATAGMRQRAAAKKRSRKQLAAARSTRAETIDTEGVLVS